LAGKFLIQKHPKFNRESFRALQVIVKNVHPDEWWIAAQSGHEAQQIFFNEKLDLKESFEVFHRATLRNNEAPELQDDIEGYAIELEKKMTELSQ
jgi:hypothetical protein